MRQRLIVVHVACICLTALTAHAQDRPFVFSLTTAPESSKPQVLVDYDVGVGARAFHNDTENGPEHRIGVQASLGRWTVVGRVGLASVAGLSVVSTRRSVVFSTDAAIVRRSPGHGRRHVT